MSNSYILFFLVYFTVIHVQWKFIHVARIVCSLTHLFIFSQSLKFWLMHTPWALFPWLRYQQHCFNIAVHLIGVSVHVCRQSIKLYKHHFFVNRLLSRGGHVESPENEKLCVCTNKLVFKFFTARLEVKMFHFFILSSSRVKKVYSPAVFGFGGSWSAFTCSVLILQPPRFLALPLLLYKPLFLPLPSTLPRTGTLSLVSQLLVSRHQWLQRWMPQVDHRLLFVSVFLVIPVPISARCLGATSPLVLA